MPSQKTAEKAPEKKEDLIEIIAVRGFAVEISTEKQKKMQSLDKEKRSHIGVTEMITPGNSAFVTKTVAKKLQDCGAAKVKL